MSFLRRALMGRSSRRWGAGWARITRQSLHKSVLIARSQNGPIYSLDISKFRGPAPPLPKPVKSVHRQARKSSNFVPSDGLIFMQTFALTLFKRPAYPEPQRTCKVCIRSSPKTPIFVPDGVQTPHIPTPPPPKKDLSPTPTQPAPRCGLPRCPGVLGCRGECSCRWHLRCASV